MRVDIGKKSCVSALPFRLLQMHHISAPCGQRVLLRWGMVSKQHASTVTVPKWKVLYFKKVLNSNRDHPICSSECSLNMSKHYRDVEQGPVREPIPFRCEQVCWISHVLLYIDWNFTSAVQRKPLFPKSAVLFWLPSFSIYQLCKWTVTRISTIRGNFFGVTRSLRRDRQRGSLALSLLVPQLSASKLFISQSIIFSLFWTPVLEMKRQTARAVFLHLRSGKHDLLGLHSPPKHTPTVPTCCLKTHTLARGAQTPRSRASVYTSVCW